MTLPPLPEPSFLAVRLGMTPNQSMAYTESEMRAYGEACAAARDAEIERLRAQLAIAARGLKHCAGWNIHEDKRNALMSVVLESEAMLAAIRSAK